MSRVSNRVGRAFEPAGIGGRVLKLAAFLLLAGLALGVAY